MPNLSCVVITKNEERNLPRLLQSINGLVDELIVVDSLSTDRSKALAQGLCKELEIPLKWVECEWAGFGQTKNFGNSLATWDWILSLDADEELTPELREEILAWKIEEQWLDSSHRAWKVNRKTFYCGDWIRHSGWSPDWHVRLFRRSSASWSLSSVHEKLEFSAETETNAFKGRLNHYTINSLEDHLERINRYSNLGAEDVLKKFGNAPPGPLGGFLRGLLRGLRHYLLELGFLDGWRGFSIATLSGFAVYLKYLKAYSKRRG